nr:hypothetical protein [Ardenticatena sp.]
MKRTAFLSLLLLAFFLLIGTTAYASTITLKEYDVHLVEFIPNGSQGTWVYAITRPKPPSDNVEAVEKKEISHWVLEYCSAAYRLVSPQDGAVITTPTTYMIGNDDQCDGSPFVCRPRDYTVTEGYDGSTGAIGIKWDVLQRGPSTGQTHLFIFTLERTDGGVAQNGTASALIKAGRTFERGPIDGPVAPDNASCNPTAVQLETFGGTNVQAASYAPTNRSTFIALALLLVSGALLAYRRQHTA